MEEKTSNINPEIEEITPNFIDVKKIITAKSTKLGKWLPGFIFRYLRKTIHQDEVNEILYRNREKLGLDFVKAVLIDEFKVKVNPIGLENIPKEERLLIVANHPLGGMDGMALMHAVGKVRTDLLFPVNDILLNLPPLRPLFIPINKHGSNKDNIRLLNNAFESDSTILYFPAGLVSRKQGKIIEDLDWQKTFITKAKRYKRTILPVHIDGANSKFFYNLAHYRKKVRVAANIEMLYLVDEMFRQQGKTINITIGSPIDINRLDRTKPYPEWAEKIKRHVYALKDNPQKHFFN